MKTCNGLMAVGSALFVLVLGVGTGAAAAAQPPVTPVYRAMFVGVTDAEYEALISHFDQTGQSYQLAAAVTGEADAWILVSDVDEIVQRIGSAGRELHAVNLLQKVVRGNIEWMEFRSGGTIGRRFVKAVTRGIEEIDYGLRLRVFPGPAQRGLAPLEVQIDVSVPVSTNGAYTLLQRTQTVEAEIPPGSTLLVSGMSELVRDVQGRGDRSLEGLPVLRWLLDSRGRWLRNRRILVLIAPLSVPREALVPPRWGR